MNLMMHIRIYCVFWVHGAAHYWEKILDILIPTAGRALQARAHRLPLLVCRPLNLSQTAPKAFWRTLTDVILVWKYYFWNRHSIGALSK